MHAEAVNDRAKLIIHRLAARALLRDPALMEAARERQAWLRGQGRITSRTDMWDDLLAMPTSAVARRMTGRGEQADILRSTSPFPTCLPCLRDVALRRRIWRKARLGTVGR